MTSYEVNYEASRQNLYNWYTSLGLVCLDKSATGWIATSCYIGIFVSVIFIPRLGDILGRRPIFVSALWGSIPVLCLIVFVSKVALVDLAAALAGPAIIARMSCGFLMLMEHMERKN